MTTMEYAKSRNIGYYAAYYTVRNVKRKLGRSMAQGRGDDLDPKEIQLADEYRGTLVRRPPEVYYKDKRSEWLHEWEPKPFSGESPRWAVMGLLHAAKDLSWYKTSWLDGALGDFVLKIAMDSGVDFDGSDPVTPWKGFTRWLIDQGYKPR